MSTLFISDLHLSGQRPAITGLFRDFLQGQAAQVEALYILGDLFEVWIGDDALLPEYQPCIDGLRALTDSGVPVYVMQGNRDFLLGVGFAAMSGTLLLPDPSTIMLYGEPTLLTHGDTLCVDDVEYQHFRDMVRGPQWQQTLLAKTPQQRLDMAREYRKISQSHTAHKAEAIMDVNANAVATAMRAQGVQRLIHGHTHRPGIHNLSLGGGAAQRIVLGDWYEQGSVLVCDETGCRLEGLSTG